MIRALKHPPQMLVPSDQQHWVSVYVSSSPNGKESCMIQNPQKSESPAKSNQLLLGQ